MSDDTNQNVDTNSADGLGNELKGKGETKKPDREENPRSEPATPLFLRDRAEGNKGTAQDEKDATGE